MAGLDRSHQFLELLLPKLRPDGQQVGDPLLESVVVNYMLTVAYSDIEFAVRDALVRYAAKGPDERINSFVERAVLRLVRSVKCTELSGVLGLFSDRRKRHFQAKVNDTHAQTAYDRIVAGRHEQAHSLGSDLTLDELIADLEHCQVIIAAFDEALACVCEDEHE